MKEKCQHTHTAMSSNRHLFLGHVLYSVDKICFMEDELDYHQVLRRKSRIDVKNVLLGQQGFFY